MAISKEYIQTKLHKLSSKIYAKLDNTHELSNYYWNMHRGNKGFSTNSISYLTAHTEIYAIILPVSHYHNPNGETIEDYEEQETRSRIYYEIRNDQVEGFSVLLLFNLQKGIQEADNDNEDHILRQQGKIKILQTKFEAKFDNMFRRDLGKDYVCYTDDTCRRFALKLFPRIHRKEVLDLDRNVISGNLIKFHDYMQPILENFLQENTALLRQI
jgi:hypothetical protein